MRILFVFCLMLIFCSVAVARPIPKHIYFHSDKAAAQTILNLNPRHPAAAIEEINCRSIPLWIWKRRGLTIGLVTPTECMVVAKNGRGQPLFCGLLYVQPPYNSLKTFVSSDGADCKVVKAELQKIWHLTPPKITAPIA